MTSQRFGLPRACVGIHLPCDPSHPSAITVAPSQCMMCVRIITVTGSNPVLPNGLIVQGIRTETCQVSGIEVIHRVAGFTSAGGGDGGLAVWGGEDGSLLITLEGFTSAITALACFTSASGGDSEGPHHTK
jgi:hypothetical protein